MAPYRDPLIGVAPAAIENQRCIGRARSVRCRMNCEPAAGEDREPVGGGHVLEPGLLEQRLSGARAAKKSSPSGTGEARPVVPPVRAVRSRRANGLSKSAARPPASTAADDRPATLELLVGHVDVARAHLAERSLDALAIDKLADVAGLAARPREQSDDTDSTADRRRSDPPGRTRVSERRSEPVGTMRRACRRWWPRAADSGAAPAAAERASAGSRTSPPPLAPERWGRALSAGGPRPALSRCARRARRWRTPAARVRSARGCGPERSV